MAVDMMRSYCTAQVRFVQGDDALHTIRWYPCVPGARALPLMHAFGSSLWEPDTHDLFEGPGQLHQPIVWASRRYPAPPGEHYHGEPSWYADGVPAAVLADPPPARECLRVQHEWWAELIDRDAVDARYGHRELTCDESSSALVPLAGGRSGTLTDGAAWEVSGRPSLPVPGSVVRMREGCGGHAYHFDGRDLAVLVEVREESPSVLLGDQYAYDARVAVPALTPDPPGEQDVTGGIVAGQPAYVLDLRFSEYLPLGSRYVGRVIGRHEGRTVYAIRSTVAPVDQQWGCLMPVRAVAAGAVTASGPRTVDGVACVAGDRVLLTSQLSSSANGVYVVQAGAWTRADDLSHDPQARSGLLVPVAQGTALAHTLWQILSVDPVHIGIDPMQWVRVGPLPLTVQGETVAGSRSNISTLEVRNTDGLYVTGPIDPTIAVIGVFPASRTTPGTISIGPQDMGDGIKTFAVGVIVNATGVAGIGLRVAHQITGGPHADYDALRVETGGSGGTCTVVIGESSDGAAGPTWQTLRVRGAARFAGDVLTDGASLNGGGACVIESYITIAADAGFVCNLLPGVTGTTYEGDTVTGGIITAIGPGAGGWTGSVP